MTKARNQEQALGRKAEVEGAIEKLQIGEQGKIMMRGKLAAILGELAEDKWEVPTTSPHQSDEPEEETNPSSPTEQASTKPASKADDRHPWMCQGTRLITKLDAIQGTDRNY